MEYDSELTELGEQLLQKRMGDRHPHALLTRGLFVVEFLDSASEYRGVVAVQIGRQGPMQPYEVLGLLTPVQAAAQRNLLELLD